MHPCEITHHVAIAVGPSALDVISTAQQQSHKLTSCCCAQEIYVFILPFILKWVVAALVVSVLVNLFSSLRKQGDHSHSSVVAQIQALLIEWWQRLFQRAPSNQSMLVTLFRLNGRGRSFKAMPSFIRYSIAHCGAQGKFACSLTMRQLLQLQFLSCIHVHHQVPWQLMCIETACTVHMPCI